MTPVVAASSALDLPSRTATDARFYTIIQQFLQIPDFRNSVVFCSLSADPSFSPAQKAVIERIQQSVCPYFKKEQYTLEEIGITDEAERIKIAEVCAERDAWMTAKNFTNFGITNRAALAEIAIKCLLQTPICLQKLAPQNFEEIFADSSSDDAAEQLVFYITTHCPGLGFEWISPYLANIQDAHAKEQVMLSLAAALFILRKRCTPQQIRMLNEQRLIEYVYALRAPHQYLSFIDALAQGIHLPGNFIDVYEEVNTANRASRFDDFRSIGCAMLAVLRIRNQATVNSLELLQKNAWFKDARDRRLLLTVLLGLVRSTTLTKETIESCLGAINGQKNRKNLLQTLNYLVSIFNLGETDRLSELATLPSDAAPDAAPDAEQWKSTLRQLTDSAIKRRLLLEDIPDVADRFEATFGQSRQPQAIFRYAAKMYGTGNPAIIRAFNRFVSSVLMGNFIEQRYSVDREHPHLQALERSRPGILTQWQKKLPEETLQLDAHRPTEPFNPLRWLQTKLITDRHLDLTDMPLLRDFLTTEGPRTTTASSSGPTERPDPTEVFQRLCIEFAAASTPETQLEKLHQMKQKIEQLGLDRFQFGRDIADQITSLKTSVKIDGLHLTDTDKLDDLLLCGTEVLGSCQDIDGDPNLNKGLLGYLLGHIRVIAAIDKNNRIQARALLRLLIDAEGNPVLFLERHYGFESCAPAIEQFAKKKAEEMGLALTRLHHRGKSIMLHSLGGPAPFEYCDAGDGLYSNGRFTIFAELLSI